MRRVQGLTVDVMWRIIWRSLVRLEAGRLVVLDLVTAVTLLHWNFFYTRTVH